MSETKSVRLLKPIIIILFIISGATGLMYQVVWFKYLGLFLGNSTYAQMIVLATFLGGLALGNHFFGKRADAFKNPLFVYAALELFIGVYCFLFPTLSEVAGNVFISLCRTDNFSFSSGIFFTATRTILAVVLLIFPTIAMGGTLPALSRAFVNDLKYSQRDMGILYGLNSFGAVLGVLYSGFFLIQYFGLDATVYIAAVLNCLIGAVGIVLSKSIKFDVTKFSQAQADAEAVPLDQHTQLSDRVILVLVIIAGTSGFAALLYEMVWVRLLIQIFGSSTYAFSVMLMAFIGGISLGSLIAASQRFRKFNRLHLVAVSQAAITVATAPVLLYYDRLIYYTWVIASYLQKNDATFALFLLIQFLLSFVSIILPTIFMGITLPVIVSAVAERKNVIGLSVGRVFSVNTIGCVLGSVLTGIIFLPWLGMRGSFELGMAVNIIGAIVLFWLSPFLNLRSKQVYAGVLLLILLGVFFMPAWNVKLTLSGVFRNLSDPPPPTFSHFDQRMENRDILYYKEGTHANVALVQLRDSIHTRVLNINGKGDASTGNDMGTQILLGQIPMLLHDNPREVFVVGLGSGVTIGSVLTHNVQNVDCAEIAEEVVQAAHFFKKENNNCLENPKLHLHIEDALTYMKLSTKKFDVIISEPSNPWIAGIGNLFSKEYFELCKSRLNTKGIMVQWFHLYEMDDDIIRLVMNTFQEVYPHRQLWMSLAGDIIMVGSNREITLNEELFQKKMSDAKIIDNLRLAKIDNAFTFLSTQILGSIAFYTASSFEEINTERHPLLEFRAPRSLFKGTSSRLVFDEDERFVPNAPQLLLGNYLEKHKPDETQLNNAIEYHHRFSRVYRLVYSLCEYALAQNPANNFAAKYKILSTAEIPIFKIRPEIIQSFSAELGNIPKWKGTFLADRIQEEVQKTSLIFRANIDGYVTELLPLLPQLDSISQVSRLAEIADAYYKNSEPVKAQMYANQVVTMINKSTNLQSALNLPYFLYLCGVSTLLSGDIKNAAGYALTLEKSFPAFEKNGALVRRIKLAANNGSK